MTTRTIQVNGTTHNVLNAYSCGPGEQIHTYRIAGAYVSQIGKDWQMQLDGQLPVKVAVAA